MSYSLAFSKAILVVLFVADKVKQGMYEFVPTKVISEALNIAGPTAVKILQSLNRAGIIETREGARGGVRLARKMEDITVLDIFNAIEQERPLFRTDLNLNVTGQKPTRSQKAVLSVLKNAETEMKNRLSAVSLADLIDTINR